MTSRPQEGWGPPAEFVRERRELMLRRARIAVVLGGAIVLGFIVVDAWRIAPERYARAIALRAGGAALLLPLLLATGLANAVRWSTWIAGAVFVVLMASTAAIMPLFQGVSDPEYAIQGTGIVLCILGAGLLLPFDWPAMLGLGLAGLALHVGFTLDFPLAQNFPVLVATVCSIAIATVGARELTRIRLADFEGRRAKEELLRARSDFVAMLTHDIRNPLAVIDGFVQMLREQPELAPEERDELLARMQRAVRNAIGLAVNFLDTSKIEADRFILKTRTTDVGDLLQRALSDQTPFAAQKGVRLLHESEAGLPPIDADAAALDRVFANLVSNAIKHTPGGGTVRIIGRRLAPDRIEVVVEDTGEGIPAGEEARIFDRYTRSASRADSTGLGLFIARTITTAHGGTISAENRRDGRGARFRVMLPATVPDASGVLRPSS